MIKMSMLETILYDPVARRLLARGHPGEILNDLVVESGIRHIQYVFSGRRDKIQLHSEENLTHQHRTLRR